MSIEEKLSVLSQMIAFAQADTDRSIKDEEYDFLLAVASQIGVSKKEFDHLFDHPAPYVQLQPESQRIVQFHRLLLLMNVDQAIEEKEIEMLHVLGLKMGLNAQAIDKTLEVMHSYEDKLIPAKVLLDIFKTYYN